MRGFYVDCWLGLCFSLLFSLFFSVLLLDCDCFQHLQKVHVEFSHQELLEFYNKVRLNSLSFPLDCLANKTRHGTTLKTVKRYYFFSFAARDDSSPAGFVDLMLMAQFIRVSATFPESRVLHRLKLSVWFVICGFFCLLCVCVSDIMTEKWFKTQMSLLLYPVQRYFYQYCCYWLNFVLYNWLKTMKTEETETRNTAVVYLKLPLNPSSQRFYHFKVWGWSHTLDQLFKCTQGSVCQMALQI